MTPDAVGGDGGTASMDAWGRRLPAVAVTAEELAVLRAVLRPETQDEAGRALLAGVPDD